MSPRYDTTRTRVVFGVFAAWLLPSYMVPTGMMVGEFLRSGYGSLWSIVPLGIFVFPLFSAVVGAPGLIVGYSGWRVLHTAGRRGPKEAALLGAAAGAIQWAVLVALQMPLMRPVWHSLILLTVIGPLVGLAVWRIVYRPASKPAEAFN